MASRAQKKRDATNPHQCERVQKKRDTKNHPCAAQNARDATDPHQWNKQIFRSQKYSVLLSDFPSRVGNFFGSRWKKISTCVYVCVCMSAKIWSILAFLVYSTLCTCVHVECVTVGEEKKIIFADEKKFFFNWKKSICNKTAVIFCPILRFFFTSSQKK